jgi:hypothetical protein
MAAANHTEAPMTARSPIERALAWLITGPLGHLAAAFVDWLAIGAHWLWFRARGRDPWG